MPAPTVTTDDFEDFTGIRLDSEEKTRIQVLSGRAARRLDAELNWPETATATQEAMYTDAVCELSWMYWEAEKAHVMEILAIPVSQLSLGNLFWTKEASAGLGGLGSVNNLLSELGNTKRLRFVLEGELDYPVPQ